MSGFGVQPALVRHGGLLQFALGDPNKVLSPDSEKLGLGQGFQVSGKVDRISYARMKLQLKANRRISNIECRRKEFYRLFKIDREQRNHPSTFDIQYSLFDIRFFFKVSFPIRLEARSQRRR